MQYKWYTFLLTTVNLVITLALIFLLLPATVPVHINTSFIIDGMGSPFLAILPFAVLPLIFNLISIAMRDTRVDEEALKFYRTRDILIAIYALFSITLGWLKFCIAYSGGTVGMTLSISPMLIVCLIPAILLFIVSTYLPTLNLSNKGINFAWINNNPLAWLNTQRLAYIIGVSLSSALYFASIFCYMLGLNKIGYLVCGVILLMYVVLLLIWSIIFSQASEDTPVHTIENTIPQDNTPPTNSKTRNNLSKLSLF